MIAGSATVALCLVAAAALLGTTAEGVSQALRSFAVREDKQQLGTQLHWGVAHRKLWEKVKASELSEQQCLELLVPRLPKVALMFLVLDDMPHEEVWYRWLDGIDSRYPVAVICNETATACADALPHSNRNTSEAYMMQNFYTIYVHTKPDFPGYPEGSLFHKREVPAPIQTAWGDHSLASALRLLLASALEDPLNQRFQLLCPATVPIRPALFTYTQLMAETRSRVGWTAPAEQGGKTDWENLPVALVEKSPEGERHARFHRQFVTLVRKHAQILVDDTRIHNLFHRHCFVAKEQHKHVCVSDEQYVGIALSYSLRDNLLEEVTSDLAIAMATTGDGFAPSQVSMELIVQLRGTRKNTTLLPPSDFIESHPGECHASERLKLSVADRHYGHDVYHRCEDYKARSSPDEATVVYPHCPYFARKFAKHSAKEVADVLEQLRIAA